MRLNIGKSPRPPASPNMIVFVFNKPGFLSSNFVVSKCHRVNLTLLFQTRENISQSDKSSLTNCPHYIVFCEVQSTPITVSIIFDPKLLKSKFLVSTF